MTPMKYRFYILDVFTRTAFGGNQLEVLPDAWGLSADGMQKVARASRMDVVARLRNGTVVSVNVGGPAVLIATGQIEVVDEWLQDEG